MKRSSHKQRIAVVTGTRAEFGLLESVIRELNLRPRIEAQLIVTGMHLLPRFGRTIDQIRAAGFRINAVVPMQTGRDEAAGEPLAVARGIAGIARALSRLKTDIVVVLGDRIEAFAAASAATIGRRVLAHIHGGDRAVGDVDEALRDAITRLAHVHLAASREAASRLRRMGEAPWRIHFVGAPGLDDIRTFLDAERRSSLQTNRWLERNLGPLANKPYAVIVQHPRGRLQADEFATMGQILHAAAKSGLAGAVIYPNSDPGHGGIVRAIRGLKDREQWRVFRSLAREDYLRLCSRAEVLLGNSSSGIIESASLGIPAVNVGPRQAGRLKSGPSVIDAGENARSIIRAIRRACRLRKVIGRAARRSVYGDGKSGKRTAALLERLITTPRLLQKQVAW